MSYSALVAKTWDQAILSSVLLELTYRCNLDCVICYNDRVQQGVLLEEADYLRLLEDLAALQVLNLVFSGGEPLAHPDFWSIGRQARKLGFVVRIKSNGHALGPALARRLKDEVAPFMIDLSLHGACAATHDRQTRIPGSFARLMDNLQTLRDLGLRLKLNSPLTVWNEAEIEEMFALAEKLGLRLSVDTRLTPRDDGDVGPLELSASVEGIRKVLRLQRAKADRDGRNSRDSSDAAPKAESSHHCGAGSSTLAIDPYGNVFPCVQWRQSLGNLHDSRIAELWKGSKGLVRIRSITAQVKTHFQSLQEGDRLSGFCPALAEQRTGSPLLLDPETRKRLQALDPRG